MRTAIIAVLTVGALCGLTASAQVPAPTATPLGGVEAAPQSWVFGTHPTACNYDYVIGIDTAVGWVAGEIAWFNLYDAGDLGECPCITGIETRIAQAQFVGRDLKVYIWNDVNNDRDPLDGDLIGQGLGVPLNTDPFTIALDTPAEVTEHFWVAGVMSHIGSANGEFPAPYDTGQRSLSRGWMGFNDPLFDAVDLGANSALVTTNTWPGQFPEGVWQVRPIVGDPSLCPGQCEFNRCDMNCDTVVNAEDIEPFIDLLFNNGVQCEVGCTGDTNGDGTVNAEDIEGFINCLFP